MSNLALGNESVATRFMSVKGLILLAFRCLEAFFNNSTFLWNAIAWCQF